MGRVCHLIDFRWREKEAARQTFTDADCTSERKEAKRIEKKGGTATITNVWIESGHATKRSTRNCFSAAPDALFLTLYSDENKDEKFNKLTRTEQTKDCPDQATFSIESSALSCTERENKPGGRFCLTNG